MSDGAKLEDSNMAKVGSAEDHALKKKAAETEPAWKEAGKAPGVQVWRIEKFKVVPWPKPEYGNFYKGDSYIVLSTTKDAESEKLLYDIHFWLGSSTSTDEKGTAAYKTVELDELFDGAAHQHRETEGHESDAFRKLFSHIHYMEGGVESGFHHVGPEAYIAKLLEVRKDKHGMQIMQVPLARDSMSEADCFVLDAGTKIFKWFGGECNAFERHAAATLAENLENQRDGKAKCMEFTDDAGEFWKLLGGEGPVKAASDRRILPEHPPHGEGVLFKLDQSTGTMLFAEVARGALTKSMLTSDAVYILDTTAKLYIWVGKGASPDVRADAMIAATKYLEENKRPEHTSISKFQEGEKIRDAAFNKIFAS